MGDDRRRHGPGRDAARDHQGHRAGARQEDRPAVAQARKHPGMTKPVVISAALTGVLATRDLCPAIPYTPSEIGEEAKRAADAGAAIVHVHARNPEGGPEWRVETFAEILSEV